jgi:hypothetical protein
MTGAWPVLDVDHIDGVGSNNAWANLRDVPTATNIQNRRSANSNNTTGHLGVSLDKRRDLFRASIDVDGKQRFLGYFASVGEAHSAYLTAKRAHHAGCTI